MTEPGPEGYEQDRSPEEQEQVELPPEEPTTRGGRIGRLMRQVWHPTPRKEDPRNQPVVTNLLSHISESGGENFDQFDDVATARRWMEAHPRLTRDQEYALAERIRGELSDEQIHTLATEQMPQLLNAVFRYQLPLEDYQTALVLAETAALQADTEGRRLALEAGSDDFKERVASAYRLLTDEKIFDPRRLRVASEMLREVITANGMVRIAVVKGRLEAAINDTIQYNLFRPETKKLYDDFMERLKVSLKYNPNRTPHDELYELPGMDDEQLFYEAQREAYRVQKQDQAAQPLEESEQVMLPLETRPWELIALHEDQHATVKGIESPEDTEPVEKRVPIEWLVRPDVVETHKKRLASAA